MKTAFKLEEKAMQWSYAAFSEDQPPAIVNDIINKLKELSPGQEASMKIAMSDQESNPARGIVIWDGDADDVPAAPKGGWTFKTFTTENDYDSALYKPTVEFLNSLQPAQALNARVTFTNRRHGDATMTVLYPANS